MDRAFASGASGTPPTAPASPSIGYPTKGNAGTGTPATKPGEYWYHMITEEMRAVIAAAGLTPSQSDLTQLLRALPGALASRPEMARSLASSGYQKLPSGLIIQWALAGVTAPGGYVAFPISFPTAVLCIQLTDISSGSQQFQSVEDSLTTRSQCWIRTNLPAGSDGFYLFALGY